VVLAAIDCTGHGVPGAFMSMVGNALMNNIIKEKRNERSNEILAALHEGVRQTLQQATTKNNDGMDMSLVVIDFTNKTLEFAGAKNPLVYIQNGLLKTIKGDRVAIGGSQREAKRIFTSHTLSFAEAPITFYMFSDGYQDQFGGPKNKKFMSKELRRLFHKIHEKPMKEQRSMLDDTFEQWKGKEDQIDDVLVVGCQVG
ncbi:MAG: SpoIIE family protein phosphatase, partial [Bacteroidota bacterium]